jgi:hypothetical protein
MNRKDVKIIHTSLDIQSKREIESYESLSQLGYKYIRIINPIQKDYPPVHNVIDGRLEWIVGITKPDPDQWGLTSGHYGAWNGHINSILCSMSDLDYSLICECDCLLNVEPEYFKDRIDEAIEAMEKFNYKIVRFEVPNFQTEYGEQITENLYSGNMIIMAHCYLINPRDRNFFLDRLDNVGWHTPDWWLNFSFERANEKMAIFRHLALTKQASGVSAVDNTFRPERFTGIEGIN